MINLIHEQNDIDKIYLYARDLSEPKYEYLIKKREDAEIKHLNNPNAFIECSNTMDDFYENINDYYPIRKRKKLIAFDDMITDIMTNKGLDKDDKKEGLFRRLKNIEKAQKKLIRDNDNKSIHYTPRSQFDSKDDEDKDKKTK